MPKLDPAERLKKRLELGTTAQQGHFSLLNECDEAYHVKGKPQEGGAQIIDPTSWGHVETLTPRMVARRPTVIFKPRPSGTEEGSKRRQALYNYWWDKDGAFTKHVEWAKGSEIHGTKLARIYWKTETTTVKSYEYGLDGLPLIDPESVAYDELTGEPILDDPKRKPKFVEKEETVTTFDDPCMEVVNTYNLFIDPAAKDVESARWIVYRYEKTLDELEAMGTYQNLGKLRRFLENRQAVQEKNAFAKNAASYAGATGLDGDDSTVNRVTCHEMWERTAKGLHLVVVAAGEVVLKDTPTPFWHGKFPFVRLIDSLVPGEFWGKGEIEPVLTQQNLLNTYQSMDADNKTQLLQPLAKLYGDVDESELVYRPFGTIHLQPNKVTDVEYLTPPDLTGTSSTSIAKTQETMQNALGINDAVTGETDPNNITAAGRSIAAESANARFDLKIQHLEEAMKEVAFQVLALYEQFLTEEREIRIVGKDGKEEMVRLTPAEIAGQYDIELESGSSKPVNKDAERQDRLQVYSLMQAVNPDPAFQFELQKFVLEGYENASKIKDALEESFARFQKQQEMMVQQEQRMLQADQQVQDEALAAEDEQSQADEFVRQQLGIPVGEPAVKTPEELEKAALRYREAKSFAALKEHAGYQQLAMWVKRQTDDLVARSTLAKPENEDEHWTRIRAFWEILRHVEFEAKSLTAREKVLEEAGIPVEPR